MGWVLFLILVGVPIVEIALFIEVGGAIGLWPTVAVCIATAAAGTLLVRLQGLQIVRRAQARMERNEPPAAEMFHGICLLLAGFLLLTPGFFTDAMGLLLLIPPVRVAIGALLWRHFEGRIHVQRTGAGAAGRGPGNVIEGEFEEVDGGRSGGASRQPRRNDAAGDQPRLPPEGGKPNPSSPWSGGQS
jgi:UPF0716 protein FxsA